ncbi:hypothetical protein PLICRDRAFT_251845 [Plicaturopsis crispa FD-325 SS-3]|nr:hypothetical protein PLICRDRAFT_251845 [Plicaturopsis crispa FD-325 SS-3]
MPVLLAAFPSPGYRRSMVTLVDGTLPSPGRTARYTRGVLVALNKLSASLSWKLTRGNNRNTLASQAPLGKPRTGPESNNIIHPGIPVEILERILYLAWTEPLTHDERIALLLSCPLVNRTWQEEFGRVSAMYVYIPTPAYAVRFWTKFRGEDDLPTPQDLLCRSLIVGSAHWPQEPAMLAVGPVLNTMLWDIRANGHLPNLRTLHIEHNKARWDFSGTIALGELPKQITGVTITRTSRMGNYLASALRTTYARRLDPPSWTVMHMRWTSAYCMVTGPLQCDDHEMSADSEDGMDENAALMQIMKDVQDASDDRAQKRVREEADRRGRMLFSPLFLRRKTNHVVWPSDGVLETYTGPLERFAFEI